MVQFIAFLTLAIQFISAIAEWRTETDAGKKAEKLECVKEVFGGIETRDPSRITAGFDRLRNV